jgi:polyisoprenoid-binding protein YceI
MAMKLRQLMLACACALPMLSWAAAPVWNIVADKSTLGFAATQNGAPVAGKFKTFTGVIHFAPDQLDTSSVAITVEMASVATSYGEVGATLQTPDWFDVKQFPQAVFRASHFVKKGAETYQADGTLTIRHHTVPAILNFSLEKYTATDAIVKGTAQLKRSAFGVGQGEWAKTDSIKDDVTVDFLLTASRK